MKFLISVARFDTYGCARSAVRNRWKIVRRLAAEDRDNFFKQLLVRNYAKHKGLMLTPMWWDSLRKCFQHEMDRINILAVTALNKYKEAPIDLTGVKGGKSIEGKMRTYLSGFWMLLENALREHREKTIKRFKRNIVECLTSSKALSAAEGVPTSKQKGRQAKGSKKAETVSTQSASGLASADGQLSKSKSRSFFSSFFKTKRQSAPANANPSSVVISMPTVVQHANIELDTTGAALIVNGSNHTANAATVPANNDTGSENKLKHGTRKEGDRGVNFKTLSLRRSTGSIARTAFIKPIVKDDKPFDFRPFPYGKCKRSGELVTATPGFVSVKGKAESAVKPVLSELPQLVFFSTNFVQGDYVTYFTADSSGRTACFSMKIIGKREAEALEAQFGVQKQVLSTNRTGSSLHELFENGKRSNESKDEARATQASSPLAEKTGQKEPATGKPDEVNPDEQKSKHASKKVCENGNQKKEKKSEQSSHAENEDRAHNEHSPNGTSEKASRQEAQRHEHKKRKMSDGEHERGVSTANGGQFSVAAGAADAESKGKWGYGKHGRYATMRNYFGTHRGCSLPSDRLEGGESTLGGDGLTDTFFLVASRAASGNSFAVVTYKAKSAARLASRTAASAVCTLLNFAKDKCKRATATPELHRGLIDYDYSQLNSRLKFGVMYRKTGQLEDGIFGNKDAPRDFYDFMGVISERVEIEGYGGFLGGLCARKDDVRYTYANNFHGYELVFHVAPLLHYDEGEQFQLQRKRHIGNDICSIVYNAGRDPLPTSFIRSEFVNAFVVVSPVFADDVAEESAEAEAQTGSSAEERKKESSSDSSSGGDSESDTDDTSTADDTDGSEKRTHKKAHERGTKRTVIGYRVDSAARECTPSFGPPLPKLNRFIPIERKNELKEIVLTKLINAEIASYHHSQFVDKLTKARADALSLLAAKHGSQKN